MCGIVGYYGNKVEHFNNTINLDIISHRGPDFQDFINGNNFYLGHSRLSIVDLSSNGNQPMFSKDRKYVIVFNGEIYNHLDLRNKYLQNHNFISTSDTETLLYGLISMGDSFINKLNGIFSFSFYNCETEDFIIVRDHFGVKPLYYYIGNNEICFSSEIKGFIDYLPSFTIDKNSLKNYLNFLWSPGELTPLKEIKKLLPGNIIKGNSKCTDSLTISEYYNLNFNDSLIPLMKEIEWIELLESKLIKAVQRQLMSDVPIGFFLSGGLDSSIIVAIARKLYPKKKLVCYTIKSDDFQDEGFGNDLNYAKIVAEHLNVDLKIINADSDILKDFDRIIYHLDEPQADPAAINVYNICKYARKDGIKVLLGGTAGDDIFSGYRRHNAVKLESYINKIPLFIRKLMKILFKKIKIKSPLIRRLKKLTLNFDKNKEDRMIRYFDWIEPKLLNGLFNDDLAFDHHLFFKDLKKRLPKNTSDLNTMLNWELKSFLVDHNLNYTDKLSMAVGLEVRVPFLDKELVEFSTKIPLSMKMKNNETKYILKKVAEKYLPNEVVYRSKTGFGAPVRKWIVNDMDHLIKEYLSKDRIEQRGIFNYNKINDLIEANKSGLIDASYTIWALLAVESWMLQFKK